MNNLSKKYLNNKKNISERDKFILSNLGLVNMLMGRFHWYDSPIADDIRAYGYEKLIEVADKYKKDSKGIKFSTFATTYLWKYMTRYARRYSYPLTVGYNALDYGKGKEIKTIDIDACEDFNDFALVDNINTPEGLDKALDRKRVMKHIERLVPASTMELIKIKYLNEDSLTGKISYREMAEDLGYNKNYMQRRIKKVEVDLKEKLQNMNYKLEDLI